MGKIRYLTIYSRKILTEMIIVVISDIHKEKTIGEKNLEKLANKIDMAEISHIIIAGDSVNSVNDLKEKDFKYQFQKMFDEFSKGKPTIVGYGNHDQMTRKNNIWVPGNKEILKQTLEELPNFMVLENGEKVTINNIEYSALSPDFDYYENKEKRKCDRESPEDYKKLIEKHYNPNLFSEDKYSILVTHEPQSPIIVSKELGECFQPNTNLVVSGHYHGGLVPTELQTIVENTPLNRWLENRGLLSPQMQLAPKYAWGTEQIGETTFLINNPVNTRVETPLINNLYGASATILTLKKMR